MLGLGGVGGRLEFCWNLGRDSRPLELPTLSFCFSAFHTCTQALNSLVTDLGFHFHTTMHLCFTAFPWYLSLLKVQ